MTFPYRTYSSVFHISAWSYNSRCTVLLGDQMHRKTLDCVTAAGKPTGTTLLGPARQAAFTKIPTTVKYTGVLSSFASGHTNCCCPEASSRKRKWTRGVARQLLSFPCSCCRTGNCSGSERNSRELIKSFPWDCLPPARHKAAWNPLLWRGMLLLKPAASALVQLGRLITLPATRHEMQPLPRWKLAGTAAHIVLLLPSALSSYWSSESDSREIWHCWEVSAPLPPLFPPNNVGATCLRNFRLPGWLAK